MSAWTSYRLQDFIPFTADIYFRLLERMGETFWPLHLLTLALGATALLLTLKNHARLACLLTAPLWAFVALTFFLQRYAELNWAGGYVGYAFIVQFILLLLIALTGLGLDNAPHYKKPPVIIGTTLVLLGLIVLPLIAPLTGGSWPQSEVFGIHPDPTAIITLGLTLILLRGFILWAMAIIPALWMLISGLTLMVLGAPGALALFAALAIGLIGLVWKQVTGSNRVFPG